MAPSSKWSRRLASQAGNVSSSLAGVREEITKTFTRFFLFKPTLVKYKKKELFNYGIH